MSNLTKKIEWTTKSDKWDINHIPQEDSMIIVTGNGKIIKDLDKAGVIRELQAAQKRGDKYCSVTGAIQLGLDPLELEREAGYKIGATAKQCERSLDRSARKYLRSRRIVADN